MNKLYVLLILCCMAGMQQAQGQSQTLYLKEVVSTAQKQSPLYFRAKNQALNRMYNFQAYRSGLLPRIELSGTVLNYSKEISRVQQPDGTFEFRNAEQNFSSLGIYARQNISATGGTLSVYSNLQRNDIFSPNKQIDYYAIPFSINYDQPVLLYNRFKWENKIQPLLYQESQKEFVENMEEVALNSTQLYFDALRSQIDLEIARINVANTDTLYQIARGRYEIGRIAENDLLQMELGNLNARNNLERTKLRLESAYQELKRFLGIDTKKPIEVNIPTDVPTINIPLDKAVTEAKENRQAVLSFRRQRLEAEQNIAQARSENSFNLNVGANLGQSQQGMVLGDVYRNGLPQQNLRIGVSIPIVDWGQTRARIRQARANRDLVEVDVKQEEVNFEQEIYLQVMQFNIQNQQLSVAAKADTIAQKRYEVTKQRYYIGKISITDLNLAQAEKDQAKQTYINSLNTYWSAYYTLRRLTLYDFEENKKISFSVN